MHKLTMLLALGGALLAPAAAHAGYAAIAASTGGSSYVSGYPSMESARAAAVAQCRRVWGGSCAKNTAESDRHYFAAGDCDGEIYTAASIEDWGAAVWLVKDKARRDGYGNCHIFARE